jgi:glycosyltransferase involved in cell wall biosynthesis
VQPLRILVVATKAPWPPVDGGRLVLFNTIAALAARGHEVVVVAPCTDRSEETARALSGICTPHLVAARPHSSLVAAALCLTRSAPVTIARHTLAAVRRKVGDLLDAGGIDVVHAEQLHTLAQATVAAAHGVPVVHRAHNVESTLWATSAEYRGPLARPLFAFEARRMSAYEVRALGSTACTVVLTEVDRRALSELVPGAVIHTIRAPFEAELPTGDGPLIGDPAVVTLASSTWAPSRDAVDRLAGRIWPTVRRRLPGAMLHIFGGDRRLEALEGVVCHPPPGESRAAFPTGAIVVIPERHPTGVPMKALESWARGLPLLVDRPTAEILEAGDGEELVVAADAHGYADALARLAEDDGLRERVVNGGRRALAERHDPAAIAEHLERVYRWAMGSPNPTAD